MSNNPQSPITVDFTGVDKVPHGDARVRIVKVEQKTSSAGNPMLAVQLKIVESAEDPDFNDRTVFDTWMLATAAVFRTKNALKAFTGQVPDGPFQFTPADLIGAEAMAQLEIEEGSGEYAGTKRTRVRKYVAA